jgi:triacylglycerol lipase
MPGKKPKSVAGFSSTPVMTRGGCHFRHENDSEYSRIFCVSDSCIFVPSEKRWQVGDSVRISFRVLDEVTEYDGYGTVEKRCDCPQGYLPRGMMVRFDEMKKRPMGFSERLAQIQRVRKIALDTTVGAARYVLAEARGNRVERELGQPGSGFRRPVLLIQGWFGTRGSFAIFENKLKARGFPVFSFHLGAFNIQDITESAEMTAEKIKRICAAQGIPKIEIIGHSMGGLIGLYALKKFGVADCVHRMITVGTPFFGTPAAVFGLPFLGLLAKSLWQMVPGSGFIANLHDGDLPPGVEVVSILSRLDMLAPEKSCVLPQAKNLLVSAGHAALVVNDDIFSVVEALLTDQPPFGNVYPQTL